MEKLSEDFRAELKAILDLLSSSISLRNMVDESIDFSWLSQQSNAPSEREWHLLVMLVHEAIRGYHEPAVPMAVAFALFKKAAEIFDDIEDGDSSSSFSSKYGVSIASNTATVLIFLAERAIFRLKSKGIDDTTVLHIMNAVNSYYTTACAGQHLDISLGSGAKVSEDAYFKVSEMKSASHVECMCHVGALLATDSHDTIDTFTIFGHNLGMASQIANDIQGITVGNDIRKRKITLPVIYCLAHGNRKACDKLKKAYSKHYKNLGNTEIQDLLFNSGAIHYSTIKMDFYKEQALEALAKAEKSGFKVARLKKLL